MKTTLESTLNFVNINSLILKVSEIKRIDLSNILYQTICVELEDGSRHFVEGFPALEIIYLTRPSYLEGKTFIQFKKHSWAIHNIIAHPVMQILAWLGFRKQAIWIHDITIPMPRGFK